jgi:CspA family cold shock protein
MTTGTVTWADAGKGYGFIAADGGERELFVSRPDMSARSTALRVGARVDFEEHSGRHGRGAVTNVVVRPDSPPPTAEGSPESDAENEGMPPKPESPVDTAGSATLDG